MCIYGYVRVSTPQQKTKRQIDNIKAYSTNAVIYEEKQTGTNIESREVFKNMLKKLKTGDTVIFDSVSRMSRNEIEGYSLYMELMNKGISLVFLKEAHIDTAEFQRRTEKQIIQKNIRYDIQHADSLDYNAMKCHYLLTQIADILMQLYEKGRPGIRKAKGKIKNISSDLLKGFGKQLTGEDISFISAYGYVKAA